MNTLLRSTHSRIATTIVTAALVVATLTAGEQPARSVAPGVDVVYIADGRNFPDALVGSVLAAANNTSILTVAGTNSGDFIPDATKAELTRLEPLNIVILGGEGAVSAAVEAELASYTTGSVSRLDGLDRYETAAAISQAIPDAVKRALNADDADLLDGKDSTKFAQRDLQMRHGSSGFHSWEGNFTAPTRRAGIHYTSFGPQATTVTTVVAALDAPYDAGPIELFGSHLWGELTGLTLCYSVDNANDPIVDVSVYAMGPTLVASTAPGYSVNSTQPVCATVPLVFEDNEARTLSPLHVAVTFDPQGTGASRSLTIHGMRSTWTTFSNQLIVLP